MKLTATLEVILRDLPKILAAGVEVAEVEVDGKSPVGNHHMGWHWFALQSPPAMSDDIPPEVFNCIRSGESVDSYGRRFQHAAEARKALSDAVIVWAKQQQQQ